MTTLHANVRMAGRAADQGQEIAFNLYGKPTMHFNWFMSLMVSCDYGELDSDGHLIRTGMY